MTNKNCACGDLTVAACENYRVERAASLVMMELAMKAMPQDYANTLAEILVDWRTHSFPECDPLAIK
jgi:hypothetical protein